MLYRTYEPDSLVAVAKSQLASGAYKPVSQLSKEARKRLLQGLKQSRAKQHGGKINDIGPGSRFSNERSITNKERGIRFQVQQRRSKTFQQKMDEGTNLGTKRGVANYEHGNHTEVGQAVQAAGTFSRGTGRRPGDQVIVRNKQFFDSLTPAERKKILTHEGVHAQISRPLGKRRSSYRAAQIEASAKKSAREEANADWRAGIKMRHRVKRADRDATDQGYQSGGYLFPKRMNRKAYFKLRRKFDEMDNPSNKMRVRARIDPRANPIVRDRLSSGALGGAAAGGVGAVAVHDKNVANRRKQTVGVSDGL